MEISYTLNAEDIEGTLEVPGGTSDKAIVKAIKKDAMKNSEVSISWEPEQQEHEFSGELRVTVTADDIVRLLNDNFDVKLDGSTYEITDLTGGYESFEFTVSFDVKLIDGAPQSQSAIEDLIASDLSGASDFDVQVS